MTYPHTFTPIRVGHLELRNRVIMGSMHLGLEEESNGMEGLARFYAERARGEVGLIVTGGISPNRRGALGPNGARMQSMRHARQHRVITEAVHQEGGRICLQILHGGRYSYHPFNVAPSALKAPINRFKPRALSTRGVKKTIQDFIQSASLAKSAGYDGVEIMGSEGYLINQFLCSATNHRTDRYGGDFENRMRFPLEIISGIRRKLGDNFLIIYRLSMLDLVESGSSWDEVIELAKAIEQAGASAINTGIGWHEARIPTIATLVPRGGFQFVTKKLMGHVQIPLITTNRFNNPVDVEKAIADGAADMVSMARPFLADPNIVKKSREGEANRINTCIACNQACLDQIFERKVASCLVNPRAGRETQWPLDAKTTFPRKVAVVGAGPAGLSCATECARLGHEVHLFERASEIGGQFNMAKIIPGKEEFYETLRYYKNLLDELGVHVHLNTNQQTRDELSTFDHVVVSTGVLPRSWKISTNRQEQIVSYIDVLQRKVKCGKKIGIIGTGGIGFDVAEFLTHQQDVNFYEQWGIDTELNERGGLTPPKPIAIEREIHMFQRSSGKVGSNLGKTTGWIHRNALRMANVQMHSGVTYGQYDEQGLHFQQDGVDRVIELDQIIVCAGQLPNNPFGNESGESVPFTHIIGGAKEARDLDAQRAILEGLEMAYNLEPWS